MLGGGRRTFEGGHVGADVDRQGSEQHREDAGGERTERLTESQSQPHAEAHAEEREGGGI